MVYLNKDKVSSQVSSLKKTGSGPQPEEDCGLGIENGSFKWNEVEEEKKDAKEDTRARVPITVPTTVSKESTMAVDESLFELNDHRFELHFSHPPLTGY